MFNRMTPMKRAGLEVTMRQLGPNKCASMKEYIDKLQIMHQEIMHARSRSLQKTWPSFSFSLVSSWITLIALSPVQEMVESPLLPVVGAQGGHS